MADHSDCRIRTKPASQCCCHQEAIHAEERCFPVDTNSSSDPITVNGTYSEHNHQVHGHSFRKGRISWPEGSDPDLFEKVSPTSLTSVYKDQEGNELTFHWKLSFKQWMSTCVDQVSFAEPKQFRWGTRYQRKKWKKFKQSHTWKCISEKYTRYYPSGQALFRKVIAPGKCLTEPSQTEGELHLKALSQYSFKCPDNYVGSTDSSTLDKRPELSWSCKCETTC